MHNLNSLDTIAAALAYAMKIDPPEHANTANADFVRYLDESFGDTAADRVFMYNPDAIAEWVYRSYPQFLEEARLRCDLELPLSSVMPSVTPVNFATMYTGAQPVVHGIQKYTKPVLKIDTLFDALIRAGKKVAIIAYAQCSIGKIFLERDADYFIFENIEEVNAKAAEIILRDEHDFIVVYNGNYDSTMHKNGTEAPISLAELKVNSRIFGMFDEMIKTNWKGHNTLIGFAMDHGCHDIDAGCGSHGLDMDEDINIVHFYKTYTAER
ncbi:MAG: alkaline phosphatase family protein [Clostridia bacterium]|nr:alkaline phosphatase family protein [Clostridia bacterium]